MIRLHDRGRCLLILLLVAAVAFMPRNWPAAEEVASTAVVDCRAAAAVFEAAAGLPHGLLLAVGRVESGRWNPATGAVDPWPWTTNLGGDGHYFASARDAVEWTAAQQALGNRSIDTGCFQVNLQYHPFAFANLADAFDPAANARYAASFLRRLYEQTQSWPAAIALYHSADPFEGQQYASRVFGAWTGSGITMSMPVVAVFRPADRVVVRLATAAAAVRVEVPAWVSAGSISVERRAGLPRVFMPSR